MRMSKKYKKKVKNRSEIRQIKPISDPELMAIREKQVLPALYDLQSQDLTARFSAVNSILNLIQDQKSRKLLLREQIVKILLERIIQDANLQTKADGWSILRSLVREEEADFGIYLYRQDILVNIDSVIKIIIETIRSYDLPVSNLSLAQQDVLWKLISSIIDLLTSLLESHNEIVETISELPIVLDFLFELLTLEITPIKIKAEVQSCLILLTEDNKTIVEKIIRNEKWLETLHTIKDSNSSDAIYSCGILHNVFASMRWSDYNAPIKEMTDAMLIPILSKFIEQSTTNNDDSDTTFISDQALQLSIEILESIATCLLEAIEHGYPKEKGVEDLMDEDLKTKNIDIETDNLSEEMNDGDFDIDMDVDVDTVTNHGSDNDISSQDVDLTLDRLVRMATPKLLRNLQSHWNHSEIIKEHTFAALNNISWTISSIDDSSSHLASLRKVWASLAEQIWDQAITPSLTLCTNNMEFASLITSLAWAVARSVKGTIKLTPNEDNFINLYQASVNTRQVSSRDTAKSKNVDNFQSLGVKCVGVLGNLACEPTTIDVNRKIGNFLISILLSFPNVPQAEFVESLNQIIDIYSDCSFSYDEPVFWGDKFFNSLEEILPKTKRMTKSIDKRKFTELRIRADEAVLNLGRFLTYKKKEKLALMKVDKD